MCNMIKCVLQVMNNNITLKLKIENWKLYIAISASLNLDTIL